MQSSFVRASKRATLLAGAVLVSAFVLPAQANTEVGQVTRVANYAYQTPPGASKAPAYERDPVFHDAAVEAVNEGGAELTFLDGSKLTVGPGSTVVIDDFVYDPAANAGTAAMRLTKGMLRYVSGSMPEENVKLETDTVTIGIRGTIVKAGILPDGFTIVSCVQGSCVVTSKLTGQTLNVPGSWFVRVDGGGNLNPVQFGIWEFGEQVIDDGMIGPDGNPSRDENQPTNSYDND